MRRFKIFPSDFLLSNVYGNTGTETVMKSIVVVSSDLPLIRNPDG